VKRFASVVAVGLLGGWSPLAAQSQPSTPSSTTPSYSATLVVTASLEPAPPDELAATTDVVPAAELERLQADLALDALRLVPGLAVAQSGSPGKVASLFVRGAGSSQTLALLDGVTLNDPVLGGFDWSALSTEGLERIEIVRGPLSALWGSQAMGGVVQLVTRRATSQRLGIDVEAGQHDARRGAISAAVPFGRWAVDFAGSLRRGDGELPNDGFDADQQRLRLDWRPSTASRVGALLQRDESRIGLPYDFFGIPADSRRQDAHSLLVAMPFDWVSPAWHVEGQLARNDASLELADPDDPFAASRSDARRDQGRAVVTRRWADRLWVAGGIETQRESATTSSAFGPGLSSADLDDTATFAQASWSGEHLRLEGGVRRDEHSEFGGETTSRVGLVVSTSATSRLRASWGQSFRAPSLGDLFYPFFGNPALRPETGESWELGWELRQGGAEGVMVRLSSFGTDFENLIQYDPVRFLPENIGRARTRGVEASLGTRRRAWTLRADATWLESEDLATGDALPRRPRWSGDLVAGWRRADWDLGATLRYVGSRSDVGGLELPAYFVADVTASLELAASWRPYARVENLFDRSYEEIAGFPAPRRTFTAGVAWRGAR